MKSKLGAATTTNQEKKPKKNSFVKNLRAKKLQKEEEIKQKIMDARVVIRPQMPVENFKSATDAIPDVTIKFPPLADFGYFIVPLRDNKYNIEETIKVKKKPIVKVIKSGKPGKIKETIKTEEVKGAKGAKATKETKVSVNKTEETQVPTRRVLLANLSKTELKEWVNTKVAKLAQLSQKRNLTDIEVVQPVTASVSVEAKSIKDLGFEIVKQPNQLYAIFSKGTYFISSDGIVSKTTGEIDKTFIIENADLSEIKSWIIKHFKAIPDKDELYLSRLNNEVVKVEKGKEIPYLAYKGELLRQSIWAKNIVNFDLDGLEHFGRIIERSLRSQDKLYILELFFIWQELSKDEKKAGKLLKFMTDLILNKSTSNDMIRFSEILLGMKTEDRQSLLKNLPEFGANPKLVGKALSIGKFVVEHQLIERMQNPYLQAKIKKEYEHLKLKNPRYSKTTRRVISSLLALVK